MATSASRNSRSARSGASHPAAAPPRSASPRPRADLRASRPGPMATSGSPKPSATRSGASPQARACGQAVAAQHRASRSPVGLAFLAGRWMEAAPSAYSRDLFGDGQMRFIRTPKVGTDPLRQLASGQQPVVLDDVALGMHPFGFDGIEPGALRRQQERQDPHALARLFDLLIVLAHPGPNGLTLMPGGVIPNQEPVGLALFEQALAAPLQELGRDGAHWSSGHEPQPGLRAGRLLASSLLPQHTITCQCLGIRVILAPGLLHQAHRLLLPLTSVDLGQRKATPPDFIAKADRPRRLLAGPSNQAVPRVFFCWYNGSGLGIQCLARFQLVFKRLSARRTLSSEMGVEIMPCSKLTSAANSKVHSPRSVPKSRGLRCSRSLRRSSPSSEKLVCSRWGREDPSCSTVRPVALNSWITLRTVWSSQPSWRAISGARSPRADALKIWQRRITKALDERSPSWIWCCSSSVKGRIKIGVLMPFIVPHFLSPLVGMHQGTLLLFTLLMIAGRRRSSPETKSKRA